MALQHASSGDVIDVRPYGARIDGAQSIALFKSTQLEVMRLVLPAGHRMPPHHAFQALDGDFARHVVRVDVAAASHDLPAGHLMYVAGGVEHALTAIESASVLVTIAL